MKGVAVAFLCGQQSLGRRKRTWVMAHGQGSPRRAADGRKVYQSQVSNLLCIPGASHPEHCGAGKLRPSQEPSDTWRSGKALLTRGAIL